MGAGAVKAMREICAAASHVIGRRALPDRIAVMPQYLLPKQAADAAGRAAGGLAMAGGLTTAVIRGFIGSATA